MQINHLSEEELYDVYTGSSKHTATMHLRQCTRCSRELEYLRDSLDRICIEILPEPDASFEMRLWQRLETRLSPRSSRLFRWGLGVAAATGAAALVLTIGSVQSPAALFSTHLERAQILLTEVRYGRPDVGRAGWEQQQALQLLIENREMQRTPNRTPLELTLLAELENALELVAIGSTNGADATADTSNLLFKLRVTRASLEGHM